MATIKYLIQSKSKASPIYLRLSLDKNKSLKRKTGLLIDSRNWNKDSGFPRQNSNDLKELKTDLMKLSVFVLKQLNESNMNGIDISGDWLKDNIDKHFNRNQEKELDYLINYADDFLELLKYRVQKDNSMGVSISTKKKYQTIVRKLKKFEECKRKKFKLIDVDLAFHSSFMKFLIEKEKLSDNTVGRYLKVVKTICLDAEKNGFDINNQIRHFKGFTVKAPIVTLSFDEIDKIAKTNYQNENHIITRDWLIIGCYTGQRVSDLMRMNKEMIQKIQNFEFIVLTQTKTNKLVQIPIHHKVSNVLKSRGGDFPPLFNSNIEINNVLFNKYLKEVVKKAEIDEVVLGNKFDKDTKRYQSGMHEKYKLISSHICRRSFASNFYANRKYPTPLLMNITAHSTEKMFLEYIGKKPIDYSLRLAEIWSKEMIKGEDEVKVKLVSNNLNSK